MPQFRFAVSLRSLTSRKQWIDDAKKFADLGFDTIVVADHLGMAAPFPALALCAEHTSLRIGTLVSSVLWYNPYLYARDAATLDLLSDGRLDIGLGAGNAAAEFAYAHAPYPPAGERVTYLQEFTRTLKSELARQSHEPRLVQQPHPPILIAAGAPRSLKFAAEEADIINVASFGEQADIDKLYTLVHDYAQGRDNKPVLQQTIAAVGIDQEPDVSVFQARAPHLPPEKIGASIALQTGSAQSIAEYVLGNYERNGVTYYSVFSTGAEQFASVINLLR